MRKHIDDIFKDQFDQFEAPVPDGLWDKIQQNPGWQEYLRKKKIRKWAVYGVLAVTLVSVGAFLLLHGNRADQEEIATVVTEEQGETENMPAVTAVVPETDNMLAESTGSVVQSSEQTSVSTTQPLAENMLVNTSVAPASEEIPANQTVAKTEVTETQNNTISSAISSPESNGKMPESNAKPQTVEPRTAENKGSDSPVDENTISQGNEENETPFVSLFSIPNAFTPNGDGLNDIFKPVTAAFIPQYQLDIFSMSGQHIFSSKNIEFGWNGEYQGGAVDNGTYVYVIKYKDEKGKEHIDKGQLLLIR